jgi:hypothetical protein
VKVNTTFRRPAETEEYPDIVKPYLEFPNLAPLVSVGGLLVERSDMGVDMGAEEFGADDCMHTCLTSPQINWQ